jgi:hypothetical protein
MGEWAIVQLSNVNDFLENELEIPLSQLFLVFWSGGTTNFILRTETKSWSYFQAK